MRGKAHTRGVALRLTGITPAYAGKRLSFPFLRMFSRDHPRLCGEKQASASSARNRSGSPPPMRGKAKDLTNAVAYPRITPAYAGKSSTYSSLTFSNKDHPRLCGEKQINSPFYRCFPGSPPPMRGKDSRLDGRACCKGITPAYAGKRECERNCTSASWDHPRLCGEKYFDKPVECEIVGSPPPMRGKE